MLDLLLSAALASLLGGLLAYMATRAYLPLARRLQLLDTPNARSAHAVVTPSSGGIAIIAALFVALAIYQLALAGDYYTPHLSMFAALLLICCVGAIDDWRHLSVAFRLLVYLAVAVVSVWHYRAIHTPVEAFLALGLILALAWLYNLFNFMDGIDGLAALQAALSAGAFALIAALQQAPGNFVVLAALSAGVYAGFLWLNWPPAKLFMGDAGSLSAGFLLGWLGLWGSDKGFLPLASWVLVMSPFLLDATLTLLRRAVRREPLAQAHSQHIYQRLARHFGHHAPVSLGLGVLHIIWLLPLALLACTDLAPSWTFVALGLFPQLFLIAKCWRLK